MATPYSILGEGNGNLLQYSCLENPMNRGAWQATFHGVTRIRHNRATNTFTSGLTVIIYFLVPFLDIRCSAATQLPTPGNITC